MKNTLTALKSFAVAHKLITGTLIAGALLGSYWMYSANTGGTAATKYVLAAVERNTIVSSISASGQVASSDTVDIKSKVSGDVVYTTVANGANVFAGELLLKIDSLDAEKAVRDAQSALDRANLDLQKIQGGTQNGLTFRGTKEKALITLQREYQDSFVAISAAFRDFPDILSTLNTILYSHTLGSEGQWNASYYAGIAAYYDASALQIKDKVYAAYNIAKKAYEADFADYSTASLNSDQQALDSLLTKTNAAATEMAQAIKYANDLIRLYHDKLVQDNIKPAALSEVDLSNLASVSAKITAHLNTTSGDITTIQNQKETLADADFDVADQQLKVRQAGDALADAKTALNNHFIRAPFTGVLTKFTLKASDSVSNGTAIASLISKSKIAEISLNEVDIVKIADGQKATLTFDAIQNLSITGVVTEVDVTGTASQGVVNYALKIAFDTDDNRIRPGMSVSAAIITSVKSDVLVVPNSAVKSQGGVSYVETYSGPVPTGTANIGGILLPTAPTAQMVETGESNELYTEIISGLTEGQEIVARTVTTSAAAKTTTSSQQNGFFSVGGSSRGGTFSAPAGAVRISR